MSVALARWSGSSPKASTRRVSAASGAGRGIATTSANVVRNPSASVRGNFTRSSGTEVGRRIAPSSPQGNLPSAVTSLCRQSDKAGFVQPAPNFFLAALKESASHTGCRPVAEVRSACWHRRVVRGASLEQGGCHRVSGGGSIRLCPPMLPPFSRCRRPTYRGQVWGTSPSLLPAVA